MEFPKLLLLPLAIVAFTAALHAQAPAPAPAKPTPTPRPMVVNGGGEQVVQSDNLWDGVNRSMFLSGERKTANVLRGSGVIGETSMPVSVALADMDNNGMLDIVAVDPMGYVRFYFNKGTKEEPKFSSAEMSFPFLVIAPPDLAKKDIRDSLIAPRVAVVDLGTGKKDLLIGNYGGDVILMRNTGSATAPAFRQPTDFSKDTVPTMKDPNRRWGNVFSPALIDWNRDGKPDLLLGEGSYSANNIHLLLNQGTAASLKFDETQRSILAYGDGREQLNLAVVDYNGDGKNDLLISDRTGQIGIYLNESNNWKPGDELPFKDFLKVNDASPMNFSGVCTIAVGDLNGDGLFDLVVGKANGRIALSKNIGTKDAPKFEAPVELKGENVFEKMLLPAAWEVDYGINRGNFYGEVNVVKAEENKDLQPPEGKSAIRIGYVKSNNVVIKPPYIIQQGIPLDVKRLQSFGSAAATLVANAPGNVFSLSQTDRLQLKPGFSYTLSFRAKGTRTKACYARVIYRATKKLGEEKIIRGERGAADVKKNEVVEDKGEIIPFSPSANWAEFKKEFTVKFDSKDLMALKTVTSSAVDFILELDPEVGEVFLDDIKVVEKPK